MLLTEVHDRNEVLFYRLLISHLPEMLPIVYTPTIGQAIKSYSHEYRRPRGVYLSVDHPELIEESLRATGLVDGDLDLIVATDAGAILGIGDWGVGGMRIAVGKLSVYTAAGGIAPDRSVAVMLDVGTDRQSLLDDPLYMGNRHPRVPPEEYDTFLDAFVETATRMFPHAMLHWEDIGLAQRPPAARPLPGPAADLQRRHPGHGRGQPGRCARGRPGDRHQPERPPDRHLRRGNRWNRHRRPAARPDAGRRTDRGRGLRQDLGDRPARPRHQRHARPQRRAARVRAAIRTRSRTGSGIPAWAASTWPRW